MWRRGVAVAVIACLVLLIVNMLIRISVMIQNNDFSGGSPTHASGSRSAAGTGGVPGGRRGSVGTEDNYNLFANL